jgi:ABC-type transport system substrate-binding protein
MPWLTRRRTLLGMTATTTLACPAISRAASSELRVSRVNDFRTFDPAFVNTLEDEIVTASILAPLVANYRASDNAPWETRPWLASKVDPANGAVAFDVALRGNESWKARNTGQSVLADDIRFSLLRLRDNRSLPNHYIMTGLRDLVVTGNTDARLNLTAANRQFPVTVLGRGQAAILPKSALASKATADFGIDPPDQSRAYTIKELARGSHLTVDRNPNWHGDKAKYDRVTFLVLPDPGSAKAAADQHKIDVMQVSRDLLLQGALPTASGLRLKTAPTGLMVYLTMFPTAAAMRSPDVRRGIQIALDSAALVRSAYREVAAIAATGFLPSGWLGRPPEPPLKPDFKEAGVLLRALVGRASLRLAVVPPFLRNVGDFIAGVMKELGVGVEQVPLEPPQWDQFADKDAFDLLLTFAPLWRIGLQQTLARFSTLHPIHDSEIDALNAQAAIAPKAEILGQLMNSLTALGAVHVLAEENYGWVVHEDVHLAVRPDGFMDQPGNWRD